MADLSLARLVNFMEDLEDNIVEAVIESERETLQQLLNLARSMSSGTFSSSTLASMGHPYSKQHPAPPQDPAIVNYQDGGFYRGWAVDQRIYPGFMVSELENKQPYSQYFDTEQYPEGTDDMIPRPIKDRLEELVFGIREDNLEAAIDRIVP